MMKMINADPAVRHATARAGRLAIAIRRAVLILAAVLSCGGLDQGRAATASAHPAAAPELVLDRDFPDPAVIRAPSGTYYAYATQGENGGRMINIQFATSRDLKHWTYRGDALPRKPDWASRTQDFWAPHVSVHNGRYYLYYSAKPDTVLNNTTQGLCLAVAVASRPEGPFADSGQPLECGPGFVDIDPMAYDDPATGKPLLYWGSGFGPIKVRELAANRVSFAPGSVVSDLIPVVPGGGPENFQRLVEGAWVTRLHGWYYLFFSGDNCCGAQAHYALMIARSRLATGPFETLGRANDTGRSTIIAADARWLAPGHNSVITDRSGRLWTLLHAIDRLRSERQPPGETATRRVLLRQRLVWRNGWLEVR